MPGHHPTPDERDERVTLPLDPETALRALLAVKPEGEPQLPVCPSCGARIADAEEHAAGHPL